MNRRDFLKRTALLNLGALLGFSVKPLAEKMLPVRVVGGQGVDAYIVGDEITIQAEGCFANELADKFEGQRVLSRRYENWTNQVPYEVGDVVTFRRPSGYTEIHKAIKSNG